MKPKPKGHVYTTELINEIVTIFRLFFVGQQQLLLKMHRTKALQRLSEPYEHLSISGRSRWLTVGGLALVVNVWKTVFFYWIGMLCLYAIQGESAA